MQNDIEREQGIINTLQDFTDKFLQNLDCDGSTRFNGILLKKMGIPFVVYEGTISNKKFDKDALYQKFYPHYWIETKSGLLIDFKASKWLGNNIRINGQSNIFYKHNKLITDLDKWLTLGYNENEILGILLGQIDKPKIIYAKDLDNTKNDDYAE